MSFIVAGLVAAGSLLGGSGYYYFTTPEQRAIHGVAVDVVRRKVVDYVTPGVHPIVQRVWLEAWDDTDFKRDDTVTTPFLQLLAEHGECIRSLPLASLKHPFVKKYPKLRLGIVYYHGPPSVGAARRTYVAMFTDRVTFPLYAPAPANRPGDPSAPLPVFRRHASVRRATLLNEKDEQLDVTTHVLRYAGPRKNFHGDLPRGTVEPVSLQRLFWHQRYAPYDLLCIVDNKGKKHIYSLKTDFDIVFPAPFFS